MKITWGDLTKVWWSFFWRATLFIVVTVTLTAFVNGFLDGLLGASRDPGIWGNLVGYLAAIPATLAALKMSLEKNRSIIDAFVQSSHGQPLHSDGVNSH